MVLYFSIMNILDSLRSLELIKPRVCS